MSVTAKDVHEAAQRIRPYVHLTPIATSNTLDAIASENAKRPIHLVMKCENLQKIGAFKIRGATNAVLTLMGSRSSDERDVSVITHSSGNHAQAIAYACRMLNVPCEIVMPSSSPSVKKNAVQDYGAHITECDSALEAREETTRNVSQKLQDSGVKVEYVSPYDDKRVIAGQGSATLELLDQAADSGRPLDVLVTPVGGGGLLSGSAIAAKSSDPSMFVFGAEPSNADDAQKSFRTKTFHPSKNPNTIADGLRTSLGELTFPLICEYVNDIYTVSEKQIAQAMKLVFERMKLVIEPSAATGLAVVLYNTEFRERLTTIARQRGKLDADALTVGIIFSGGNVDVPQLSTLFALAEEQ